MSKLTKKLIKYYIYIITATIILCFIGSSLFLSKFYLNQQYNELKSLTEDIHNSLEKKENIYINSNIKVFLIKDNSVIHISKGNMALMHFMRNIDFTSLNTKGKITTANNDSFMYYNLKTSIGNILVFKNSIPYKQYLKITYIILISVFIISLFLSIPLTSYIGKKLSYPILQLKDISEEIAKGNFNVDLKLKTNDEIEDLYNSFKFILCVHNKLKL
ncbi:two-component sensor protein [Clostridium acetireducens DSM 10703]|uniref:Two-component sensor protein n=1 Tax=Clostridium acetireducens DSM 10703 TaxID=1121290 RepID=A0A1E8F053_9CLOT|nr:HAMP domain-containing protein [Clostridium acetireducens]OFI06787.1 two-component sensor protein [Clostridium acetireducens DSM 10703]